MRQAEYLILRSLEFLIRDVKLSLLDSDDNIWNKQKDLLGELREQIESGERMGDYQKSVTTVTAEDE